MKIIDPGHIYWVDNLEAPGVQRLKFCKRSSKMVRHANEHPGTNTQEVIRVLIDRTKYLDGIGTCPETQNALYHLRMALYEYEARAYWRKQEKLNKGAQAQTETEGDMDARREGYQNVPFSWQHIEDYPTGPDGHILV